MSDISIRYRPLAALQPAARNPKLHDLQQLKESIRRWGFVLPLVENEATGQLVAGHGRLAALQAMFDAGEEPPARIKVTGKGWAAPVLTGVSFENEQDAEAYLVADNRLVEIGGWDTAGLQDMLLDLRAHRVTTIGWSESDIDQLLASAAKPEPVRAVELDALDDTTIRQIVLTFLPAEFDRTIERMQRVMERLGLEDHTAVFLHLLKAHEDRRHIQ